MTENDTVADMLADDDDPDDATFSRRAVVASGIGGLALLVGVLGTSQTASAEVSSESLVAEGDEITSHDGSIDEVLVDPIIAVTWEGLNDDETSVEIELVLETDGEDELTVVEEEETLEGTHGEETFDYDSVDLLDAGWSADTFESDEDGDTAETTVDASLTLDNGDLFDDAEDDFTVTVENLPADVGVGGELETEIESDEEV